MQELHKLIPSDGNEYDRFGTNVDISGKYAIVSSYKGTGSAYIFFYDTSRWIEQTKLTRHSNNDENGFGSSVSIDGEYAIVGDGWNDGNGSHSGAAYIFRYNGKEWIEQKKLTPSDGEEYNYFGWSSSIKGSCAIIGGQDGVYAFHRRDDDWVEEKKLIESETDQAFFSVDFNGNYAIIESINCEEYNKNCFSRVYIFHRNNSKWTKQAEINIPKQDQLYPAVSVGISDNHAIVGFNNDDKNGYLSGTAYVYARNGNEWQLQSELGVSSETGDQFGYSVDIEGDYVLVGAPGEEHFTGGVHLFVRDGDNWLEQSRLTGSNSNTFGGSISVNSGYVLVGEHIGDNSNEDRSGSAYLFDLGECIRLNQTSVFSADTICGVNSVTLDANVESAKYQWSTGQTTQRIIAKESGTYQVTVCQEDCFISDVVYVDLLQTNLSGDITFCETIDHTLTVDNTQANVLWSTGETTSEIRVTQPGTYWVEATKGNCTVVDSIRINVIETPRETLDTLLCQGETFTWDVYQPGSVYYWEDGSNAATKELTEAGTYTVHVENQCFAMQRTLQLKTENCACEVFVPNIFTPNNDGSNDFFQPMIHQRIQNSVLRIYDRRGKLLYKDDESGRWDGTLRGNAAPAGSYYWTFDYICLQDDAAVWQHQKGWVTLLRDHSRTH